MTCVRFKTLASNHIKSVGRSIESELVLYDTPGIVIALSASLGYRRKPLR
jgi:hypothetical protein